MSLVEGLTRRLEELILEKLHLERKILLLEKKRLADPEIIKHLKPYFTNIAQLN